MARKRGAQIWSCRLEDWEAQAAQREREAALTGRQLGLVEDARALAEYLRCSGCSQEEAARRLGRSQSSVANRLRLLKLPEDVLEQLAESGLGERHARALLRLSDAESQRAVLEHIRTNALSVQAAESYVDSLLPAAARRRMALEDEGILLNSFTRCAETLRKSGVDCELRRQNTEEGLILTIFIGKKQKSPFLFG